MSTRTSFAGDSIEVKMWDLVLGFRYYVTRPLESPGVTSNQSIMIVRIERTSIDARNLPEQSAAPPPKARYA